MLAFQWNACDPSVSGMRVMLLLCQCCNGSSSVLLCFTVLLVVGCFGNVHGWLHPSAAFALFRCVAGVLVGFWFWLLGAPLVGHVTCVGVGAPLPSWFAGAGVGCYVFGGCVDAATEDVLVFRLTLLSGASFFCFMSC